MPQAPVAGSGHGQCQQGESAAGAGFVANLLCQRHQSRVDGVHESYYFALGRNGVDKIVLNRSPSRRAQCSPVRQGFPRLISARLLLEHVEPPPAYRLLVIAWDEDSVARQLRQVAVDDEEVTLEIFRHGGTLPHTTSPRGWITGYCNC